jgi:hypothetical protein
MYEAWLNLHFCSQARVHNSCGTTQFISQYVINATQIVSNTDVQLLNLICIWKHISCGNNEKNFYCNYHNLVCSSNCKQ